MCTITFVAGEEGKENPQKREKSDEPCKACLWRPPIRLSTTVPRFSKFPIVVRVVDDSSLFRESASLCGLVLHLCPISLAPSLIPFLTAGPFWRLLWMIGPHFALTMTLEWQEGKLGSLGGKPHCQLGNMVRWSNKKTVEIRRFGRKSMLNFHISMNWKAKNPFSWVKLLIELRSSSYLSCSITLSFRQLLFFAPQFGYDNVWGSLPGIMEEEKDPANCFSFFLLVFRDTHHPRPSLLSSHIHSFSINNA